MRVSPREGGVATPKPAMVISRVDLKRLERNAGRACELLAAMANRSRLMILCQLAQGERRVGELEQLLGITQPTLSQQLTVLREEGLVATRREGKHIHYRANSLRAIAVMRVLYEEFCVR